MPTTISGSTGVTFPAGGVGNTAGAAVGTTDTQTLTNKTLGSGLVAGASLITSGTAVASTSGTSIDFTSIPSWVKRVTVMFNGVSTNGTSNYLVRIGNTTFTVTGYVSTMTYVNIGANSCTGDTDTTGFRLTKDNSAATSFSGVMSICLLSNYVYVAGFNGIGNGGPTFQGGGVLNLGSVLDRVRITTVNGTDTFDAGSVNILYEG